MSKSIEIHVCLSDVLKQIEDDELIDEVRSRNLEDVFEDDDDDKVDEDVLREEELVDLKKNNHVLPKLFDRFQLRDHLINIAGLGSYVSDETLFNKLSDLLEFS